MSKEFEPSESRSGLRTDLETLEALRTGFFEKVFDNYYCPDDVKYADVADSQMALARHFGNTLDTIFYSGEFSMRDKLDLVRDLQINEDAARVDFFNFMVDAEDEEVFRPAHAPNLEDWFPEWLFDADPGDINFEQIKISEMDHLIEQTNSDMKAVMVYAVYRLARN